MRHFVVFLAVVFVGLSAARVFKTRKEAVEASVPVLRVFGNSSFVSQWGPGPWLKESFEKDCNCRVEFFDGADAILLIQRVKSESRLGADVVIGLDQYDLELANQSIEWNDIDLSGLAFVEETQPWLAVGPLKPYDFSVLSFVFRQSTLKQTPKNLDELLAPEFRGQISMQDPRTSSPGLQFLLWLIQVKGEEAAFEYLKQFNFQVKAYSTSWSMAYGFFKKKQAKTAWSYITSPLYHLIEEKDNDVVAIALDEGHPLQVEFVGVPKVCKQCDLAQKFVRRMYSAEWQKVIMEKNYMFPVIKGVRGGTPFAQIPQYKLINSATLPTMADRDRILKKWSALRR